jgi:hypothetical protein
VNCGPNVTTFKPLLPNICPTEKTGYRLLVPVCSIGHAEVVRKRKASAHRASWDKGSAASTPVVRTEPDWPSERRELPTELLAEAATNPGGIVAEIDGRQVPDANGYVPPEAIIGVFTVDSSGLPTGEFLRNPNYGPIREDFTKLTAPNHWLGWLPGEPSAVVREALLECITLQAPGSMLEWVKITEEPAFLTGLASRDPSDTHKFTVTRAGVAVAFVLSVVMLSQQRYFVRGGFSWAATGLDRPGERKDRTWFDVNMPFTEVAAALEERLNFDRL